MKRLFSILILLSAIVGVKAEGTSGRLILNIVVEGLQDNYIRQLKPILGTGGFARLTGLDATYISALDYGTQLDAVAATSMIMTGASPMVNGVPGAWAYHPDLNQVTPIFKDASCMGNFTDETLSPKALKVSTLTDELAVATGGKGKIYSVAADPQISIALGGHAATGAYWIFDRTADWASSSYFGDMPKAIADRNYRSPLSKRLDNMKWEPLLDISVYPLLMRPATGFTHTYPKKMSHRMAAFKSSPLVNTEITDVAIDLIESAYLGADEAPDILNIAYNLAPDGASPLEFYDSYLRLDRDLARLFASAEKAATRGALTIILTGIPAQESAAADDPKHRIPAGEYSIKKAVSLLNMYLIAVHGNGDWLQGVFDRQFFLNRKLITDRNLSLPVFRQEVADFLARMAGVCNV